MKSVAMQRPSCQFILVHSPAVGPVTWSWVASELKQRGHRVALPSLKEAAIRGWERCVDEVVRQAPPEPGILVGHSGAGPLLPVIAARMFPSPKRLIFVDATLPPADGTTPLAPEDFLEDIRALAQHGTLPRWSDWFGPHAMEELVPDAVRRAAVVADLPHLPLSYFDRRVSMPEGWANADGAYVLLSDTYRDDAARAVSFGWPVRELPGAHLDIVTRADDVSNVLLDLAQR